MKPFLFLLPKLQLFLKQQPQQQTKIKKPLVHFGKNRKPNNGKKRRLRKLSKEMVEDCQQATEKEPYVHKEVFFSISIAVRFPFPSSPFLLRPYLNCNIQKERIHRWQDDIIWPLTSDSTEKGLIILVNVMFAIF